MENAAPRTTPMHVSLQLHEAQETEELVNQKGYQKLVGSLNHAAVYSRPDIANAVSNLPDTSKSQPRRTCEKHRIPLHDA